MALASNLLLVLQGKVKGHDQPIEQLHSSTVAVDLGAHPLACGIGAVAGGQPKVPAPNLGELRRPGREEGAAQDRQVLIAVEREIDANDPR